MKKLLLLLCVIGATALMTSCIEGSNSYTDQAFVYIAVSTEVTPAVRHGRTSSGRAITSPQIQDGMMIVGGQVIDFSVGSFLFFPFRWDEENGRTPLSEHHEADNIVIIGPALEIPRGTLSLDVPAPEGTPEELLVGFSTPIFADDPIFWGDNWIFQFSYFGNDTWPHLIMYKREPREEDNLGENDIEFDVRVTGIQQGTPSQNRGAAIAMNMSSLREELQQEGQRNVRIRFHFYDNGGGGGSGQTPRAMHTEWSTWRLAGTEQE